jgi:beta-1,4-N-acetylglucosaminyltransferase
MLSMLRRMPLDPTTYTFRTYIVTSGDGFSASKAAEFESALEAQYILKARDNDNNNNNSSVRATGGESFDIVTVPRARRVHQSFLTAPLSTLQCFWACIQVLCGTHPDQRPNLHGTTSPYPDLILTNGPATAVCVILGAKLLRFFNALRTCISPFTDNSNAIYPLRTIFVESWARVTTFSLSGKILLPFVDRFLVQWPKLEGKRAWKGMKKTQFVGTLVE